MSKRYTVDYFIRKFEALPDGAFCRFRYVEDDGRRCAYAHCYPAGVTNEQVQDICMEGDDKRRPGEPDEAYALRRLLKPIGRSVEMVNNYGGYDSARHNILSALRGLRHTPEACGRGEDL